MLTDTTTTRARTDTPRSGTRTVALKYSTRADGRLFLAHPQARAGWHGDTFVMHVTGVPTDVPPAAVLRRLELILRLRNPERVEWSRCMPGAILAD